MQYVCINIKGIRVFILFFLGMLLQACALNSTQEDVANNLSSNFDIKHSVIKFDYTSIERSMKYPLMPNGHYMVLTTMEDVTHRVASLLKDTLKRYDYSVKLYKVYDGANIISPASIAYAKAHKMDYIIVINILKWARNYTFWTGVPDALKMTLSVYGLKKNEIVANFVINAETGIYSSMFHHVINLLNKPFDVIVGKIFKYSPKTLSSESEHKKTIQ